MHKPEVQTSASSISSRVHVVDALLHYVSIDHALNVQLISPCIDRRLVKHQGKK